MAHKFDKVRFAIEPKESIWAQMRAEIMQKISQFPLPEDPHFISYTDIEKESDGEICLIRNNNSEKTEQFQSENISEICTALLQILQTIRSCHEKNIVLGELSIGLIHRGETGETFLLDPRIWNVIKKSLVGRDFCSVTAPEVMAGRKWNQAADVFAWGSIAYQLLTGRVPFEAVNSSLKSALILRGKALAVKDLKQNVNEKISNLVMAALNSDHEERIALDDLLEQWNALVSEGNCEVSEEEARQYLPQAVENTRKFASAEKRFCWWWKNGRLCSGIMIVCCIFLVLFFMFRSEPRITKENSSREVVNFYFESIRKTDPQLMQETLYKVDNSLEPAVTAIHMLNAQLDVNLAVELEKMSVELRGFSLEPITETAEEAQYHAKYTLLAVGAQEQGHEYWRRDEILTLRPIRKVWRVVKIEVLDEERSDMQEKETKSEGYR